MVHYTVSCTFTHHGVMQRWLAWLREEHLADVCAAGALRAEVVSVRDALRLDVHYLFPDMNAFTHYEHHHAPRLRAEGLQKFPLELGLTYQRSVGDVVAEHV